MSARRLLLIDSDEGFHHVMHEQLAPYGFEVYQLPGTHDALSQVGDILPELIFIAVEEPDKLGYSLCSRAKKGEVNVPIILTTATVPPSGFKSHRRLSVHADEYIDKRTMSSQELLDKLDRLIGLGEPLLELDDLDQGFGEEAEKTRIAPPEMLMQTDEPEIEIDTHDGFGAGSGPLTPMPQDGPVARDFLAEEEVRTASNLRTFPPAMVPTQHGVPPASGGPPPAARSSRSDGGAAATNLDLGLDHVAALATEEHGGRGDRRLQGRVDELEHDNERLRVELDRMRQSSDPGSSAFSREREFLNLREIINRKEKDLNELRDEVDAKDRQILDGKGEIRQLQRVKTELEGKNLELEQHLLAQNEQISSLETDKQSGLERIRTLEHELADTRAQGEAELAALQHSHAVAVDELRQADAAGKQAALDELRGQYEAQMAALVAESARSLEDRERDHAAAMASAQAAAEADKEAALAQAAAERDSDIAALEARHASDLETMREQHAAAQAALQSKAEKDLADRDAAHQLAMEQAAQAYAADKAELEQQHADVVAALEEDKRLLEENLEHARNEIAVLQEELAEARATIVARDQTIAENLATIAARDQSIAENLATIAARDQTIVGLEHDIAELEAQNAGYQEQIVEVYRRIKSDEVTIGRAKKALAVALTLLDEDLVATGGEAEKEGAGVRSSAKPAQ